MISWFEWVVVGGVVLLIIGLIAIVCMQELGIHSGYITSKYRKGPYTTFIMCGKVMVPVCHPESWHVAIAVDGKTNDWSIPLSVYSSAEIGMWINVDTGELSEKRPVEATTK
jgi:hypothetical protein